MGESGGAAEVDDGVEDEEYGVVEEVRDAAEEVAEPAVVGKGGGVGEGVLDGLEDDGGDFEVVAGNGAEVVEFGRCHGFMIGGEGEKGNSRAGTWRGLWALKRRG